ncbi:Domain of uncharacterised function DUF20 [Leclercia adecarboxylata]|uniref:Domain of uncharacterized function DUF20 n=1 Tax=Leclercia adecarboxylata TaxID=83655 RepID=A0A4U9HJL9_9ENTR|nr:Domain of uncharacterised function DUF20 [Leclercia adecarboxylata]
MVYLLFFLLKDGPWLMRQILDRPAAVEFRQTASVCQICRRRQSDGKRHRRRGVSAGFAGRIAFWVVGINGSILWGALIAFLSLIPAVGSAIVWVPAAIYLFATHQLWQGLFIVGFFVLVVGLGG